MVTKFIDLSELRRDGIDPKSVLQQEEDQENNNVEKLVTSWYTNYIEKHLKPGFPKHITI
jgi:hypothetical protein